MEASASTLDLLRCTSEEKTMFQEIWKTKGPGAAMKHLHDVLAREGVEVQIVADMANDMEREIVSSGFTDECGHRFTAGATHIRFRFEALAVIDRWTRRA